MNKIVIIGCGNVGMSSAYALLLNGASIDELVLIDIDKEKAEGEALDLNHALSYASRSIKIYAGNYEDCNDATIIIICAGKNQNVGESRTNLLEKNCKVFESIISEIKKTNFSGIFLVATNPVDTMSLVTQQLSGVAPSKVIGTGTTLDTSRLRFLLSKKTNINTSNIHGFVLGEHGDSEFVSWSNVKISTSDISNFIKESEYTSIEQEVKNSAYEIIKKKGNTSFGIGVCVLKIVNAILLNENRVMTVSSFHKKDELFYSLPCVINRKGVQRVLDITLTEKDKQKLKDSLLSLEKAKNEIYKPKPAS